MATDRASEAGRAGKASGAVRSGCR
jgi:hypothetical protein